MLDLIFIASTVVFFVIAIAYVRACEKLRQFHQVEGLSFNIQTAVGPARPTTHGPAKPNRHQV
jgi:hypothetical protein